MSTFKSSMLLAVGSLFLTQFINHSPYSIQTYPPVHDWADQPMKLVATPYYETKKEDIWTAGATHMALVHNAMIRGFNSIYQQAPWVMEDHKPAFVGYGLTWAKFVLSHHDDEEHTLFKKVSVVLDDDEIWESTHKEHEAVTDGIAIFQGYLKGLADPRNLTAQTLIKIMDDLLPAFEEHMHSEVKVIAALDKHPRAPLEGSDEAIRAKNVFAEWGKKTITKAGLLDVLPFFLLNLDKTFEDSTWADWPPMPKPIRWTFINIVGMLRGKQMKFASCDSDGMPKELWVYNPKDAKAAKEKKKGKK